ncbi:hypothetical protein DY000_02021042 [Brassica cretica]|uniref:Aspartic peptidase DDI1-type domain-containing protein n=1 Tax=Brassica cretica TaxID=69181 RepID=A0ABQ7E2R9_BRACR|nr:hypothetical protein DY000_02021042 [Brassica cretica]
MFDTHNHGEEISVDTYTTVMRHQFNLESLGDRLQKIEDAITIMKDKWRRGDEAMRDFTALPAATDINILTSVGIYSGLEPKLTSNTKPDTTACLGAWYTWDQILQASLEGLLRCGLQYCRAREQMRKRVTLKKKSDSGQSAIPCTVKGIEFPHALCDTGASVSILPRVMADHLDLQVESSKELFTFVDCSQINSGGIVRDLEVQIGNALVPVDFHVLDIKLNWNSSLLLGRAFLSTVGAVCNLQTNQLCLTLIDPHAHYNPIPVKKPQTTPRRINDPRIIAACHCGAEYKTKYSALIETHLATSIDSAHQKSTDTPTEESVDSSPEDWENEYYNPTMAAYTRQNMHTEEYDEDYKEERATEYKAILDEEDKLLHHSSWKKNAPSIDSTSSPSIDTQPHQRNRKRASTDIAYYPSIDTNVDAT